MNKYVVISTNDNPDYYQYVPYVIKAWNKLGWKVITFLRGDKSKLQKLIDGQNIFYYLDYILTNPLKMVFDQLVKKDPTVKH